MTNPLKQWAKAIVPQAVLTRRLVRNSMRDGAPDAEVRLLPVLSGQRLFLDIGANAGSWTGPAARSFGHVHAFEPDPELSGAIRRFGPSNLTVHRLALSNHIGTARFAVPVLKGSRLKTRGTLEKAANEGLHEEFYDVPVTTLDALDLRGVDALKIDVEGHEESVVGGAMETIARERPSMVIEIEERHHPGRSEPLIDSIVDRGYAAYFIRGGRVERYERGQIAALQPLEFRPAPGVYRPDAYINNFIFIPADRHAQRAAVERQVF